MFSASQKLLYKPFPSIDFWEIEDFMQFTALKVEKSALEMLTKQKMYSFSRDFLANTRVIFAKNIIIYSEIINLVFSKPWKR